MNHAVEHNGLVRSAGVAREGILADKSAQLILDALNHAAADPAGAPLYAGKSKPGLFPGTAPARKAAQRCKEEHWLRVVRPGKVELCAITEKGLAYLMSQASPKQVLEELVRSLQGREKQIADLVTAASEIKASLAMLRATVEKVCQAVGPPAKEAVTTNGTCMHSNGFDQAHELCWRAKTGLPTALIGYLKEWQAAHPTEDCSLPELLRKLQQNEPGLTIGEFHDGLRQLIEANQIYLHPWTGPLYDIPEPALVLMVGHELAYYVSLRKQAAIT
jgi:hypothetical protein